MFSLFNAKPTVRVSSSSKPGSLFAAPASSSASKSIFSSLKPAGRSTALFSAPPAQHVASNLFRSAAPQSAAGSSTDTSVVRFDALAGGGVIFAAVLGLYNFSVGGVSVINLS